MFQSKKCSHFSKLFLIVFGLLVSFSIASKAEAATLSTSPAGGTYSVGRTITVRVIVDSAGQSINAVSGQVAFSNSTLALQSISKSGVVTLWAQDPAYSNSLGTASFQGVILNGYTGSYGTVVTLIFKAIALGTANVTISNSASSVLLNDGQGTNVLSSTSGASFTIIPGATPSTVSSPTRPVIVPSIPIVQPVPTAVIPGVAPLFTDYQSPLLPGNFVVVKGTAPANSTVTITFTHATQNGTTTVTQNVLPTTNTGTFTFVSDQKVSEGSSYKLVATTPDGQSTAPLALAVKNSLWFSIATLIGLLLAIRISAMLALLLLILITLYLAYRNHILKKHLQTVIDKFQDSVKK